MAGATRQTTQRRHTRIPDSLLTVTAGQQRGQQRQQPWQRRRHHWTSRSVARRYLLFTVSQKTYRFYFAHNSAKYWPF